MDEGSAAAPTAGLHFTKELLKQIEDMGVKIARVTLHVGLGTFRPVKVENILDHHMHSEFYQVDKEAADIINNTKANGGRVIAVGTTSTRTLESVADENGHIPVKSGWTNVWNSRRILPQGNKRFLPPGRQLPHFLDFFFLLLSLLKNCFQSSFVLGPRSSM